MAKAKFRTTTRTSLAVGTSLYAAGDALGTKVSFNVPPDGIIRAITITDVDDEASTTQTVWFFESEPTGIAANDPFALADADLELVFAAATVSTEFDAINGRVRYAEVNIPYQQNDGVLWVQVESNAGTPTYAATTDVKLMLTIEYE